MSLCVGNTKEFCNVDGTSSWKRTRCFRGQKSSLCHTYNFSGSLSLFQNKNILNNRKEGRINGGMDLGLALSW